MPNAKYQPIKIQIKIKKEKYPKNRTYILVMDFLNLKNLPLTNRYQLTFLAVVTKKKAQ